MSNPTPVDHLHDRVARAVANARLSPGPEYPCPYRPGYWARSVTLWPESAPPGVYHALMDLNFRRLGEAVYSPRCEGCDSCRQLRVGVSTFRPNRAQRRCWRANRDLTAEVGRPRADVERQRLYERYLRARHDGQMNGSMEELESFLCSSCVQTQEVAFRLQGDLVAVVLMDVEPLALSAVYSYFDPGRAARSLGTFGILWLIDEARRRGMDHVYLGFHVAESPKMSYKSGFRPCEVLTADGWVRIPE